jgi:hypothetical protein
MADLGRFLIVAGVLLIVVGLVLAYGGRVPVLSSLGRLPGDLVIRRGGTTIFVPIVTTILLSVLLTIVLSLIVRRS